MRLAYKLKEKRGDTLVESLAAILIAALGATLLATMVMASVNAATTSKAALDATYRAENSMVKDNLAFGVINLTVEGKSYPGIKAITFTDANGVFLRYEPFEMVE